MKRHSSSAFSTAILAMAVAGLFAAQPAQAQLPVPAALWLRADAGVEPSSWEDQSGNGRHASVAAGAGMPTLVASALNGHPVMRFDGNDGLTLGNISADFPSAASLFIVATINDNQYNLFTTTAGADSHTSGDTWWRFDYLPEYTGAYMAVFRNGRTYAVLGGSVPTSGSHLFAVESSSSRWEMLINGSGGGANNSGTHRAGDEYRIGMPDSNPPSAGGAEGKWLNGDIAEIIIFNQALTAEERNQVGFYLDNKYNLNTPYTPPANFSPTVSITAPTNGATYTAPATVNITADASDTDGTITKVEFYQGTTMLGEDTDSSGGWTHSWTGVAAGSYTLTAKAFDDGGASTTSAGVGITVNQPASPTIANAAASGVTANSATLNGNLTSTGTATTAVSVYWGTVDRGTTTAGWGYTNRLGTRAVGAVSTNVTGLAQGATYYYRFYASNSAGVVWADSAASFKTMSAPVVDNGGGGANITAFSARLRGTLTAGGSAAVTIYWGTVDGGTSPAAWQHTNSLGTVSEGAFVSDVSGLNKNSTYRYRCYAGNVVGTDWADTTATFQTPDWSPVLATGGTITNSGDYKIHTFITGGTLTVTSGGEVEYLIVGGGGGGGYAGNGGGGGGGGGFRTGSFTVTPQGYTITVGAGGAVDASGSPSSAFGIVGAGGGRGATPTIAAQTGGSGGGGSRDSAQPGAAGNTPSTDPAQGYAGGTTDTTGGNYWRGGSGGGGADGVGLDGGGDQSSAGEFAGDGGPGKASSISGSEVYYAGGGGGHNSGNADPGNRGDGGIGGGGAGGQDNVGSSVAPAVSGTANTGGGGGGARGSGGGGAGGSGIVIIRYLTVGGGSGDSVVPRILAMATNDVNQLPQLRWIASTGGAAYTVLKSTNLLTGWWPAFAGTAGTAGSTNVFTDTNAVERAAYYKIRFP